MRSTEGLTVSKRKRVPGDKCPRCGMEELELRRACHCEAERGWNFKLICFNCKYKEKYM